MKNLKTKLLFVSAIILFSMLLIFGVNITSAQTTEFTFQSRLLDNNLPPTANYDFEFRLFDTAAGGGALATNQRLAVAVADGVFTVQLDFGGQFTGANRWLEISVRPVGSPGGFQQLLPRHPVTSVPYAIRSLNSANADNAATATNATQLGGVAANQYVQTTDPRMSDDRNPLPNNSNYIQNTNTPQTASNFSISGTGTANIFNATQYNIGNAPVLSQAGSFNLFVGFDAGSDNTTGSNNGFFGRSAGASNTTGFQNSFFGNSAGFSNTEGISNSFVGASSGGSNTTGFRNSFFGNQAGDSNTVGSNNTIIGYNADFAFPNLNFATALGAGSVVSSSNTVVLGRTEDIVRIPGFLRVVQLGSAGAESVCRNGNDTISTCSSSLRYKSHINNFGSGLSLIRRLRPVSFNWTEGGMLDFGLVAEEVAEVEPLLTTTNKNGEIEGVKYDRVGVVLINAVNEQQAQIESQQKQIGEQTQIIERQKELLEKQRSDFEALKKLVCLQNPAAEICGEPT